jgi:hypothetical protein
MPNSPAPNTSGFKVAYRILSWASIAALVLILVLVFRKSPAPDVPYDPHASARVEQKLAAADQAKAAGEPSQVEIDRTELNSYLKDNLGVAGRTEPASEGTTASPNASTSTSPNASTPTASAANSNDPLGNIAGGEQPTLEQIQSSVKDVKVDMDGDLVKAYVIFDFHGKDLSLELDGHLSSEGGYMKFDPVAGKLGSVPLPQSVLNAAVDKLMNSPENRDKLKLPGDISDIQIQNGQAVVKYKDQ